MDVLVGTEQGHPMSPELCKLYLLEMSADIYSCPETAMPELNEIRTSHLLWADDLVLLALDAESMQKLIIAVTNTAYFGGSQ